MRFNRQKIPLATKWLACLSSQLAIFLTIIGLSDTVDASEPIPPPTVLEVEVVASPTRFDRESFPLVRNDLQLASAASCSATACHGGPRAGVVAPRMPRGSEYPLWLERDPHALSWRTICSSQSIAMMERLKILKAGEIIDRVGFDNCLACHNSTRQFDEPRSEELLREGVGCSGCHGPSEKWLNTHYQAHWNNDAITQGFIATKDMIARARMCASCHIGDRNRDMNHDMIAAGHPALHYEFATYHERQPKHWREPGRADATRFEASQWLAGQLAALDTSLVLLESRARRALAVSQWPEFSALDCSACHQQLRIGSLNYAGAKPVLGVAEYSHWNRFGVEALLQMRFDEGRGGPMDERLTASLRELSSTMQDTDSTAVQAKNAAMESRLALDMWMKSSGGHEEIQQFTADRLRKLAIAAGSREATLQNWESATQFYLASVAARESWPKQLGTTLPNADRLAKSQPIVSARELRGTLTFRKGTNSPQVNFAAGVDKAARVHLQAIQLLSTKSE